MPHLRKNTTAHPRGLRDGEGLHSPDDLRLVWAEIRNRRHPRFDAKLEATARVLAGSQGRFACALCAWAWTGDALTGTRLQREHRATHAPPEPEPPEEAPRRETLVDRIQALLREHGPLTAREVSERTGASRNTTSNLLQRLSHRGLVRRAGGGGNKLLWEFAQS